MDNRWTTDGQSVDNLRCHLVGWAKAELRMRLILLSLPLRCQVSKSSRSICCNSYVLMCSVLKITKYHLATPKSWFEPKRTKVNLSFRIWETEPNKIYDFMYNLSFLLMTDVWKAIILGNVLPDEPIYILNGTLLPWWVGICNNQDCNLQITIIIKHRPFFFFSIRFFHIFLQWIEIMLYLCSVLIN